MPKSMTLLSASVVKLFTKQKDEFKFTYSKIFGALCLVFCRNTHRKYLKILELNDHTELFDMEVTSNFRSCLNRLNQHFLYFYKGRSVIGLSFAESDEVEALMNCLRIYELEKSKN